MGAAAQFDRPAERVLAVLAGGPAHRDHADLVAILLAEQRTRAGVTGLVEPHQTGDDLIIFQHHVIGDVLDASEFFRRDRLRMHEIEAQAVGRDQRAALRDVIAEHLPQGFMQQMRRRVIGPDRRASGVIDIELQCRSRLQGALLHRAQMHEQIAGLLLGLGDTEAHALAGHHTGVADLTAGLRIERRLVQHDRARLARFEAFDLAAILHQRADHAFGGLGLIAEEFSGPELLAQREPHAFGRSLAGASPSRTRLLALAVHRIGEGRDIDADAARFQGVLRQVEREAIGVVQREGGVAVEHVALFEGAALLIENRKAALQGLAETRLFEPQRLLDQLFGAHQFRIGLTHLAHQRPDQAMHQGLTRAQKLRMAHGTAHDPAQHIAAALVRGQHAVGDQEGRGAQMVGDHPMRDLGRPVGIGVGFRRRCENEVPHQVDVVIVVLALQHRRQALQPHAGIDRRPRQVHALALGHLLELHEDQVPDLDIAVAVGIGRARRAAGDLVAMVVEDLRARAAGAGIAHLPEIVRGPDPDDLVVGEAGNLLPQAGGLVVVGVDGDEELVRLQAEFLGDQRPGQLDRAVLEVVAE